MHILIGLSHLEDARWFVYAPLMLHMQHYKVRVVTICHKRSMEILSKPHIDTHEQVFECIAHIHCLFHAFVQR